MNYIEDKEKKNTVGSIIGVAVLVIASVAGGWIACDLWPKAAPVKIVMPQMTTTVAVRPVEERVYNLPEKFVAHAEPVQEVDLLPQVDGYIKEIRFKEGDIVKAGDILYVLDGERYQAIVNQRKADLEAAEAEQRRAERYYQRMKNADSRGITQLERDNAEASADSVKAAVMQAKADLVVSQYDLNKTFIVAPISGQIGKTSAHVGDYVLAFFCTLPQVKENPDLIKRMIDEGHIVGNHSVTHPSFAEISTDHMVTEVKGMEEYLKNNFNYSEPYFRFPKGEYTEVALNQINKLGYTCVFWSLAYADWDLNNQKGKNYAYEKVVSRLHPGAVILLHSVSPDNANALSPIIDEARRQGYKFLSLRDYN